MVVRGAGSGPNGTVLYDHHANDNGGGSASGWETEKYPNFFSVDAVAYNGNNAPGFIAVGVKGKTGQAVYYTDLAKAKQTADVNQPWGYAESVGTAVLPLSLYDAQRAVRLGTGETLATTSPAGRPADPARLTLTLHPNPATGAVRLVAPPSKACKSWTAPAGWCWGKTTWPTLPRQSSAPRAWQAASISCGPRPKRARC